MSEYGRVDWDAAVAMPLVRIFALNAVAGVRRGMVAKAPTYGERRLLDDLVALGPSAPRLNVTKRSKGRKP